MEPIGQILKRQQAGTSLQKSCTQVLQRDENGYSLSAYRGELTVRTATESVARIKAAFPALAPEFFKVFIERVREKGFDDKRLIDAVNHVIDNCQYPSPTLANFLSFDQRVKVFDYNQLCGLVLRQEASWSDFSKVRINGKLFWVRNSEKELFNLPDEI